MQTVEEASIGNLCAENDNSKLRYTLKISTTIGIYSH